MSLVLGYKYHRGRWGSGSPEVLSQLSVEASEARIAELDANERLSVEAWLAP